jgi:hypothetical protein
MRCGNPRFGRSLTLPGAYTADPPQLGRHGRYESVGRLNRQRRRREQRKIPSEKPIPGVLDMEQFDAIFVRVDEANPPLLDAVLGIWRLFLIQIIPATFVGESNN